MTYQSDEIDEFYEKNYKIPSEGNSFPEESPEVGYGCYKGGEISQNKQMKLDFESPLELMLSGIAIISVLVAIGIPVTVSKTNITDAALIKLVSVPVVVFIISIALRLLLDDHYLLDKEQKKILLCRRFLGYNKTTPFAQFDEAYFTTTLGSYYPSKGRTNERAWTYVPVLVMKNNKRLGFSVKDGYSYQDVNDSAKQVAEFMGIPFKPGRRSAYANIVLNKEKGLPEVVPETNRENFLRTKLKWYILGGIIVAIIVVYLFFSNMQQL